MPEQLTKHDIERLAKAHERPELEYKIDLTRQPDDAARTCAGLANSGVTVFRTV